ncbi:pseudoazurin [Agrobacterium sp. rho-13.3]|uniref:pseudoazurin n=1 Tax=Agrobacterium sp. rho-13.3 TaxID=3072980 RepID=UPI002A10C615|nr:pseudoazurin [Agrobacterium sp. rho-13.3]MDX8307548.1 pseudoazurin [Agrobacterium sp. rho-13.3]
MSFIRSISVAVLFVGLTAAASFAETFEVRMLNQGEKGSMVFEPDFLALRPGDKVKFIATHKSHNAATIDGMVPEGAAGFKGKINEEIEVPFDKQGFYGIKCSPHYGMGMVMLIKVGEATVPERYKTIAHPARAKPRFDALIAAHEMQAKP